MRSVRGPPQKGEENVIGIDCIVDLSEFFFLLLSPPRLDFGLGPVSYPCKGGNAWSKKIASAGFWADVRKLGLNGCI